MLVICAGLFTGFYGRYLMLPPRQEVSMEPRPPTKPLEGEDLGRVKRGIDDTLHKLVVSHRRKRGLPDDPTTTTSYWYHPHMYWPTGTAWQRSALMAGLRERLGDRRFAAFISNVFVDYCNDDGMNGVVEILGNGIDACETNDSFLSVAVGDLPELCELWDKTHPEGRIRKFLRTWGWWVK